MLKNNLLNHDGYLLDVNSWNLEIARKLALKENIELTARHLQVIELIRKFYITYKLSPTTRVLVRYLNEELGNNKFNSGTLNLLFNGKPAKLAAKIAGLPKPSNCI